MIRLQTFRVSYREYEDAQNPPILHRKERFVLTDYPRYSEFAALTKAEEERGLYDSISDIGTMNRWALLLEEKRLRIVGHSLESLGTT